MQAIFSLWRALDNQWGLIVFAFLVVVIAILAYRLLVRGMEQGSEQSIGQWYKWKK